MMLSLLMKLPCLTLELATLLFEAIPDHCRLILLGDAQQLASVEVGSVLADLQQIPALAEHRVHLVNSRRFTEDALIGKMAKFIQQFQAGKPHTEILDYFQQQIVPANQLSAITLSHDMQDQVQLEFLPASAQSLNWTEFYEKLMQGYLPYLKALKIIYRQKKLLRIQSNLWFRHLTITDYLQLPDTGH